MTRVLGIETSCDETAAAVVEDGRRVLASVIATQADLHRKYGGVVPEVASRQHLENIVPTLREALAQAGVDLGGIDLVAATAGPGLVGTLLVGVSAAKAIAFALGVPLVGVNHLQGHIYANFLRPDPPEFPLVCLVVSGGHTDLVYMAGHGEMELLGRTRDDAAGEAFDKVARLLGLPYPGGPHLERLARDGDPGAVPMPRPWLEGSYDFSFSGLKTAVLYMVRDEPERHRREDIAAAFQAAVVEVLATKAVRAARERGVRTLLLAGGVAANQALRQAVEERAAPLGIRVLYPPPALCTDNAAMIAAAGYHVWRHGGRVDGLDLAVDPNLGILEG
ncbi:tRNA (adenosine(37)-N6)-threonylcarbamoyltransferase complex transferase subunit TsaD [Caldinitratiruptor microaerophilus]|uniref:tRNA N6-adenosine threonylcarbamoyltransferase n=1 Tax=Caldinitratiruptor microaerophilus TaxID=671077 RepID=A0AA35CMS6_9FIRM|nr:tRNA (adenosine(37)-N6)-threonylcarbamoyltransferase complex transferase subunit TsaD [Caldinitratiruptor microaerophilus]BDG61344.1 tRNA N6-adenosine threonylcarbamoyltransferase [Caldinitratiruptor microaerophilus]